MKAQQTPNILDIETTLAVVIGLDKQGFIIPPRK